MNEQSEQAENEQSEQAENEQSHQLEDRQSEKAQTEPPESDEPHKAAPARVRHWWIEVLPPLASVFLWTVGIGFGLGLLQALIMFPNRKEFSLSNALPPAYRQAAILNMSAWILIPLLCIGVFLLWKGRSLRRVGIVHDIVRALSPLAWLWPIPLYFDWEVFNASGLERVVLAVFWGLALERTLRHTFLIAVPYLKSRPLVMKAATWMKEKSPRMLAPGLGLLAVMGLVIWFSTFCAHYTVMQHQRLATTAFDLGIFDNLIYNLLQGEFFKGGVDVDNRGGNHLQFHANFLAYLFVPLYALSPRAETLLIIQAWVVGLSAIPFYLIIQNRLKSSLAAFSLCFVYLAHEALQGPIFYDFHFLTLAPFFIGWTLYFFEKEWRWPLLAAWICTLLLREEQGAVVSAAALVYLLSGKRPLVAFFGGVMGVVWLIAMRFYIMPMFTADGQFQQHIGYYKGMLPEGENGFAGVLKTMFTNPAFMMDSLLNEGKVEYALLLIAPFVLLPFRSPRLLFLFAPAALFTLGTRNYPPPVSKGFQYTMYWMPMLMLAVAIKLDEWRKEPGKAHFWPAAVSASLIVGGALGVNGGALFQQNSFTGGFRRIVFEISEPESQRYAELRDLVRKIPPKATVLATEAVVPHVSNRSIAYTLRQGMPNVEYFLFFKDELRGGEQAKRLIDNIGPLGKQRYGVIEQTDNFQLWKRGADQRDNLRALQSVGHFRHLKSDGTPRSRPREPKRRGHARKPAPN